MMLTSPIRQVVELNTRLISKYFKDTNDFKFLTTMPSDQFLVKLKGLKQDYWQAVYKCLESIFSYVTERDYVENQPTFFIHVASAILYEVDSQSQIKGKDHAKKGASIVQLIDKTLISFSEFAPQLQSDLELVNTAEALLIQHGQLIEKVLRRIPEETKQHLREHNNYYGDLLAEWKIDSSDVHTLRHAVHMGKTPEKTPQKLSRSDRLSADYLRGESTTIRRLQFVDEGSSPRPLQKTTSSACDLNSPPMPVLFMAKQKSDERKPNAKKSLSIQFASMQIDELELDLEDEYLYSSDEYLNFGSSDEEDSMSPAKKGRNKK